MKKIVITRKNEFMSSAQIFTVSVNEVNYEIDTDSSVIVNTDAQEIKVYAKLLWMKTRTFILNENENEFIINVRPFLNNKSIYIGVFLFALSVLFMCSNNYLLDTVARVFLISMMAIFTYTFTFGYRSYLKLEINKT